MRRTVCVPRLLSFGLRVRALVGGQCGGCGHLQPSYRPFAEASSIVARGRGRSVGGWLFYALGAWLVAVSVAPIAVAFASPPPVEHTQQPPDDRWLFIGRWNPSTGPGMVVREEVWVGRAASKWRRVAERQVLAAAEVPMVPAKRTEAVRIAAAVAPPAVLGHGDRVGGSDRRVGVYLWVVVGDGETFQEWADEASYLEPTLVAAAEALLQSIRPAAPGPASGSWLQALPLHGPVARVAEREGLVRALAKDRSVDPRLVEAIARPFLWVPVDGDSVRVDQSNQLTSAVPATIVRVGSRLFQVNLQSGR